MATYNRNEIKPTNHDRLNKGSRKVNCKGTYNATSLSKDVESKGNKKKGYNSLVNILKEALSENLQVKAMGSGLSYSDVYTTSGCRIDTSRLCKSANYVKVHQNFTEAAYNYPGTGYRPEIKIKSAVCNKVAAAYRKGNVHQIEGQLSPSHLKKDTPPYAEGPVKWDRFDPQKNRALFETEAGITISELNEALIFRNLALPNMGGYDGQTIMGAISTSTHGSGIGLPPFPDMVRSLVLVTTGKWAGSTTPISGRPEGIDGVYQYRIEPKDGITDPEKYQHSEIALIQDDDCFYSTICSMGCMGIIYSVVLEVAQLYWLKEYRERQTLKDVMAVLEPDSTQPNGLPSVFKDVVVDRDNDMYTFEILVHPYPMENGVVKDMEGGSREAVEEYYDKFRCLITKRYLLEPPIDGKAQGSRDELQKITSRWPFTFKLVADYMNHNQHKIPWAVNQAMNGLEGNYGDYYHLIYVLGLNVKAGFAAEVGFEIEEKDGTYTNRYFKDAVNQILWRAQESRKEKGWYQTSPFSLRFTKRSNAYLSMMEGQNTCMIELDMIEGTQWGDEITDQYESDMYEFGGRPHWGLDFDNLMEKGGDIHDIYPKYKQWINVYKQFNAKGTFNSSFTDRMKISV